MIVKLNSGTGSRSNMQAIEHHMSMTAATAVGQ